MNGAYQLLKAGQQNAYRLDLLHDTDAEAVFRLLKSQL